MFATEIIGKEGLPINMKEKDVKGNTQSLYEQGFKLKFTKVDNSTYMNKLLFQF